MSGRYASLPPVAARIASVVELRVLSLLLHLLAVYAAWGYALQAQVALVATGALVISLWWSDQRLRRLVGAQLVVSGDGNFWREAALESIVPGFVNPLLISLKLSMADGRVEYLWLSPRMIGAELHRRLRVWLLIELRQDEARGT